MGSWKDVWWIVRNWKPYIRFFPKDHATFGIYEFWHDGPVFTINLVIFEICWIGK